MRKEVIEIGIIILCVSIIIFIIKNHKTIVEKVEKMNLTKIINVIVLFIMIMYIFITINNVKSTLSYYKTNLEMQDKYAVYKDFIKDEKTFYSSIINLEYNNDSSSNPYIPEGFSYIEGEWDKGFVIKDKNGNEFVWVPCTNLDNSIIPKLQKSYFSSNDLISKDFCFDIEYKEFLKSALENGGFYISRYEIGNEGNRPVSKNNMKIWNNITQEEAINISHKMYDSDSFSSELINGFAYDTVLSWIYSTNTVAIGNCNQNDSIYTGRDCLYNNIFDITDNILEITSEKNYDTVITRGMYNDEIFEKYSELVDSKDNRYSILEDVKNNYTGFRVVLYKK